LCHARLACGFRRLGRPFHTPPREIASRLVAEFAWSAKFDIPSRPPLFLTSRLPLSEVSPMFAWKFWKSKATKPARNAGKRSTRSVGRFESLEPRQMMTSSGDFNGDGIQDLAIGLPGKNLGRFIDAGQVSVMYGTVNNGLATPRNQLWDLGRPGVRGNPRDFDLFGSTLAVGDFNFDGFDDLAIGAPGKEIAGLEGAGAVCVLYGTIDGLVATGSQFWTADDIPVGGGIQEDVGFGSAMTTGDFNADGFDDLAIGSPLQDRGSDPRIGAVYVLYGSLIGLDDLGAQIWSQKTTGLNARPQRNSNFGSALATGDFDGDGFDDLAIGAPDARPYGTTNVIYGTFSGLSTLGNQLFAYGGSALATGDFNADEFDDLAIGQTVARLRTGGNVSIVYSDEFGLSQRFREVIRLSDVGGTSAVGDTFGASLATGDFDGDFFDDLVIGAPLATADGVEDAGLVTVVYGSILGLDTDEVRQFTQGPGVHDETPADTLFGFALAVGDYNGDGISDLAVGVPTITWNSRTAVGIFWAYYGSEANGVSTINDQLWRMGLPGLLGRPDSFDRFGWALA
jgi:hypothetical protein